MSESHIYDNGTLVMRRGVPIKFQYYYGWMLDTKIYGNVIRKNNIDGGGNDAGGWPFAIESFYHYGMEIYDNEFTGAIDFNFGLAGEYRGVVYDYATYIHDNHFTDDGDGHQTNAIILEYDTQTTTIERNGFVNCGRVLYFIPRPSSSISDVTFRYNSCTGNFASEEGVRVDLPEDGSTIDISDFHVYNNLFFANSGSFGGFGIEFSHNGRWTGSAISVENNLFSGFNWHWLRFLNCVGASGVSVENNICNSDWGQFSNIGDTSSIANPVVADNRGLNTAQFNALFVSGNDFHLRAGSAAIDAGCDKGEMVDLDGNAVPFSTTPDPDPDPGSDPDPDPDPDVPAISLASASITAADMQRNATGQPLVPSVSVKLNGVALRENNDYVLTYSDSPTAPHEAGSYVVRAEGRGDYSGSVEIGVFEIHDVPTSLDQSRYYWLRSAASSDFVLDVAETSPVCGANVSVWTDNGGTNQQFRFVLGEDGFYTFYNRANPSLVLDAAGSAPSIGANVSVWENNGGENQKWELLGLAATETRIVRNT